MGEYDISEKDASEMLNEVSKDTEEAARKVSRENAFKGFNKAGEIQEKINNIRKEVTDIKGKLNISASGDAEKSSAEQSMGWVSAKVSAQKPNPNKAPETPKEEQDRKSATPTNRNRRDDYQHQNIQNKDELVAKKAGIKDSLKSVKDKIQNKWRNMVSGQSKGNDKNQGKGRG